MTNNTVKRSGPPPIVFILLLLGLLGGAYWFFFKSKDVPVAIPGVEAPQPDGATPGEAAPANFALQPSVAAGTTVTIDGSTSMAQINAALKTGFEQQYPGTVVNIAAAGSENGIQAILGNSIDIAASSRPLTPQEQAQGLQAVAVIADQLAVVVGNENPFKRGVSASQVAQIFQGQITNWATFGGPDQAIRVINRAPVSGTHGAFQEIVLGGGQFGTTPNITTMTRDATTPMLQDLGTDGIGYATYSQVANQQTARVLAIDGLTPEAPGYPFQRSLYYVYRDANSPAVQAFLGYVLSPQGQQAVAAVTVGN
ncbi:phosphate ABC transporter substrate-binding protein [Leptolyngbya sp. CCNP1308]|uniref:phosphate ABC transporter substrate-binding protein n=1 Tax=Leptolyngbya sp. CCNP1308 TaxID=3110255 RepID=UPI002B1EDE97|nr:phosphate ABC transporter substrate-binding protein [Leptolyngbya sp. CCNP1308]MEA5452113.1 phosphate ABC transporter substrate-binding protein [Leptolyngbya sp. CCNP1308]